MGVPVRQAATSLVVADHVEDVCDAGPLPRRSEPASAQPDEPVVGQVVIVADAMQVADAFFDSHRVVGKVVAEEQPGGFVVCQYSVA